MCCLLIVLTAIAQSAAMGSANCGRSHPPRASERDVAGAVCGVSYSASLKNILHRGVGMPMGVWESVGKVKWVERVTG